MNVKRLFILPISFILSTIIYVSCCPDRSGLFPFFTYNGVGISTYGSNRAVVDTGAITKVDTIYLNVGFINECLATKTDRKNYFNFLGNAAYALSCPGYACGEKGLKSKILSVTISSDSVYNGIAENQPLNNFFKVQNFGISIPQSIESFVRFKNADNSARGDFPQFFTTTKPNNNKGHAFTFKLIFEDGKIISATTKRIFWQ